MRAIIPTFFLFAASFSTFAEVQSAGEYKQNCINSKIAQCINSKPQSEPGLQADTSSCTSGAMNDLFSKSCQADTDAFCNTYADMLGDPSPVPGASINIPSGCASTPRSQTNTSKPKLGGSGQTSPRTPVDIDAAKADLQRCTSMGTTAQKCCAKPQSCGGKSVGDDLQKLEDTAQDAQQDGNTDSLNQVCAQAQKAADATGDLQLSYANVCSSKHVPCSDVCGQVWNKWNQTANNCTGDNCSQLSSIVAQMWQQQTTCDQLNAQEQIMADKATQQALNSQISAICQNRSKDKPNKSTPDPTNDTPDVAQNSPSPNNNQPQQQPQNQQPQNQQPTDNSQPTQQQPTQTAQSLPLGSADCGAAGNISSCVNCSEHPEYPSCNGSASSAALASQAGGKNDAGTPKGGIPNASGMNVGGGVPSNQGFDPSSGTGSNSQLASNNPAMNPYANGQPVSGAGIGVFPPLDKNDLSGSLLSRAQFIAAKKGVDFSFAGERGGNGFAGYANGPRAGSGFEGMGRGLASSSAFKIAQAGGNYVGLDLKKFLPGQFGAGRGIYGMSSGHSEIGPRSTDMFQRVSLRFKLICFQHQLLDCN